jgi:hypothetical protein
MNVGLGAILFRENASERQDGLGLRLPTTTRRVPQQQQQQHRPTLDSIVQGRWNITGDASWLIHFAIIAFPKCGTSTMMHHLSQHPQLSIFPDERCELAYNQQAKLIQDSYMYLGKDKLRGIKCPILLESTQLGMRNMQKYFPKTKYIVGIRHPGKTKRK